MRIQPEVQIPHWMPCGLRGAIAANGDNAIAVLDKSGYFAMLQQPDCDTFIARGEHAAKASAGLPFSSLSARGPAPLSGP